jgi:hypothetical protein
MEDKHKEPQMTIEHSILNLPATYSLSCISLTPFLTNWAARFEGELVGVYGSRSDCVAALCWHEASQMALCEEEEFVG